MTDLPSTLSAAMKGSGVASVAVIESAGAEPHSYWIPASEQEPAFLAYSITKTFIATLLLQLCGEGEVALDDRLDRWFPRIALADRITLRQLLNHTAGTPDYGGLRAYHASVRTSPSVPWSFEKFAAETFDKGLLFEPGGGWAYSNPGYMLLRRIAEHVAGVSFRDLIAERIVRPLGLQRTFVAESIADLSELAPGTSRALSPDGEARDVRAHYHPGWVSHGVVVSTTSDLVRFLDRLFGGELLSPHNLAQMMELIAVPAEHAAASSTEDPRSRLGKPSYGLGLMGDPLSPWGLILGHTGGGPCYTASAYHASDLGGASVCVMSAIEDGFNAEGVVFSVFDQLSRALSARISPPPAR